MQPDQLVSNLAVRLKAETRVLHRQVEKTATVRRLLCGTMDKAGYHALLVNLAAIYAALEPALQRHSGHPVLAPTFSMALFRSPALADDLRALRHEDDAPSPPLEHATQCYVHRLKALDVSQPQLLLAHSYVRYLGDLNGGQLLKAAVRKCFYLPDGAGTSFYDFGDAAAAPELAARFRSGLAQLAVGSSLADSLVEEAQQAFEWHAAIFEQLSAGYPTPSIVGAV